MKNQEINMAAATKRFLSVDATITGPHEINGGGKFFMRASFLQNVADDDGFISQSKAYTKCFFEDSHSVLYQAAEKAMNDGTPLKIKAARLIIPIGREYYILDENGNRRPKKNGGFAKASTVTLFLIADENPHTALNAQLNQITAKNAWVMEEEAEDEDVDVEEQKAAASTPAPNKGKK